MLQLSKVGLRIYVTGVRGQRTAQIWIEGPNANVRVNSTRHTLGELLELKETTRTALRQYAGGAALTSFNDVAHLLLPAA